jgi:hypothetical protein
VRTIAFRIEDEKISTKQECKRQLELQYYLHVTVILIFFLSNGSAPPLLALHLSR